VSLQSLGYEVATALGCAVVAMRYPVDERFSVAFSQAFYQSVLADGAALEDAVHSSLLEALERAPGTPLSIATPVLITPAAGLRLGPLATASTAEPHMWSGVPDESEFFVGRSQILFVIADTLSGRRSSAITLVGMPGIGKTAALTEAVQLHAHRFQEIVWHTLQPGDDASVLKAALQRAVGDHPVAELRDKSVLLVVDDAHAGLGESGDWRSPEVGAPIEELAAPGGALRLLLAPNEPRHFRRTSRRSWCRS
jgi:hypothetical protein